MPDDEKPWLTAPIKTTVEEDETPPWLSAPIKEPQGAAVPSAAETTVAPEAISPDRAGLIHRAYARMVSSVSRVPPVEAAFIMGPEALRPDILRRLPHRTLAERGFGLERDPEQMAYMLEVGPTLRPGDPGFEQAFARYAEGIPRRQEAQTADIVHAARVFESIDYNRMALLGVEGPPEGFFEVAAEAAGGLASFLLRLGIGGAVARPFLRGLPAWTHAPVVWEMENIASGGPEGEGAAMALSLQAIQALPVPTPVKILIESGLFAGLAKASGGDEVDMLVNALIPPVLRGQRRLRQQFDPKFRNAKTTAEFTKAVEQAYQKGIEARQAQGLREDYVAPWAEIIENVKGEVGGRPPRERARRYSQIQKFRALMQGVHVQEIAKTPVEPVGRVPVETLEQRVPPPAGPLVGREPGAIARPARFPTTPPGKPITPEGVPPVLEPIKARPFTKKKLKEMLDAIGVGKERQALVFEAKNARERFDATVRLLAGSREFLREMETELGSSPAALAKQRQQIAGLQLIVDMQLKPGRRPSVTQPISEIRARQLEILEDIQNRQVVEDAQVPPMERALTTAVQRRAEARLEFERLHDLAVRGELEPGQMGAYSYYRWLMEKGDIDVRSRAQDVFRTLTPPEPVRVIRPTAPEVKVEPPAEVSKVEPSKLPGKERLAEMSSRELEDLRQRVVTEMPEGQPKQDALVKIFDAQQLQRWRGMTPEELEAEIKLRQEEVTGWENKRKFLQRIIDKKQFAEVRQTGAEDEIGPQVTQALFGSDAPARSAKSAMRQIENELAAARASLTRISEFETESRKRTPAERPERPPQPRRLTQVVEDRGTVASVIREGGIITVENGRWTLTEFDSAGNPKVIRQIDSALMSKMLESGEIGRLSDYEWGEGPTFVQPPQRGPVEQGAPAVVPQPPAQARLAGHTKQIKTEYPVYVDKGRAEKLAGQVNKRNLLRDEPEVEVVPVEGGFSLEAKASPVVGRVGAEGAPIIEGDVVKQKRYFPSRPETYEQPRAREKFFEDLENGLVPERTQRQFNQKVPGGDKFAMWNWLLQEGRVKVLTEPVSREAREARGLPPQREVDVSAAVQGTIRGRKVRGEVFTIPREADVEAARQREWISDQLARMPARDREIIGRLKGLFGFRPEPVPGQGEVGREGQTYAEVGKDMGMTATQVEAEARRIMLDLRKAAELEDPNLTPEQFEIRSRPPDHRRGFIMLPPLPLGETIKGNLRIAGEFIGLEARDMIEAVERSGGNKGIVLGNFLRRVVDKQLDYMGEFQVPRREQAIGQLKGQDVINRYRKDAWNLQHEGYPSKREGVNIDRGLLRQTQTWTIDRLPEIVEGRLAARTPGERAIVTVMREAGRTTGLMLERPEIGFKIQTRDYRDAEGNWQEGQFLPFKHAPRGRVFVNMVTPEAYDLIMRGPKADGGAKNSGDGTYARMVRAFAEANPNMRIPDSFRVPKDAPAGTTRQEAFTRKIFDERIRPVLTSTESRIGFRRIGPEIERWFDRRPTGIRAANGTHIQLLITEPRKYLDALYTSTAVRAGFAQYLGQDGKKIEALRERFVIPRGNEEAVDSWKFDQAVRSMANLPPAVSEGQLPKTYPRGPADLGYRSARAVSAIQDVVKQVLLSATAPIQITEPIGFAIVPRFYWPMMRGLREAWLAGPASRKVVWQELERHRLITKDIISMSLDRSHARLSSIQRTAQILSRVHGNKFANEVLNEQPAALYGRAIINEIMTRVERGKPIRESDIYFFRLLDYTPREAIDLAAGNVTEPQKYAAMRRATRFFVGSTAISPQKSPLRNTRAYRFWIPFTSYFSNRMRMFNRHWSLNMEAWGKAQQKPTMVEKLSDGAAWRSTYQLGRFLVGVEAAGIAASFVWAALREGELGVKLRARRVGLGILDIYRDPLAWKGWRELLGFLGESFIYGSFGPVYGMFYDVMARAAQAEGEPAERIATRAARVALPVSFVFDIYDAFAGTGPYRDRDPWERAKRFGKIHTPVLHTLPASTIGGWLGLQLEDPRTVASRKAYWRWVQDPENGVKPSLKESMGSRTDEQKGYAMHMRRAKEAHLVGKNPYPHIFKAFQITKAHADPSATIRGWMLLDKPKLTDAKLLEMERDLGPEVMERLREQDKGLALLANSMEPISKIGRKLKSERTARENFLKDLRRDALRDQ